MQYPVKNISVNIDRSHESVYRFLANPENLPLWAQGLSQSKITQEGDFWVTDSPMGVVKLKFAEHNKYGVVDHAVNFPTAANTHIPLTVVKNAQGCTVIFTLYRLPRMSDDNFKSDATLVESDLAKLKSVLESR